MPGSTKNKPTPLQPKVKQKPKPKTKNKPKDDPDTDPIAEPVPDPVVFPDPVVNTKRPDGREWETRSKDPWKRRVEPYRDRKPVKRTKEIKSRIAGAKSYAIYRWVNEATEYADYVEAIWGTLDRKYKTSGKLRINDKARDIYRHLDKINLEAAVKALVANEIQDYLFGLLGQTSARAARQRGGFPIDMAGRTMRKLDTGVREAVNDLVARIMNEVFQ